MNERFDNVLLSIASQHTQMGQGVEGLLDTFFGFLARKTDFFTGAEEGVAEQVILKAAQKQANLSSKVREARKQKRAKAEAARKAQLEREKALREKAAKESAKREAARKAAKAAKPAASSDGPEFEIVDDDAAPAPESAAVKAPAKDAADDADDSESEDEGPPLVGNGGTNDKYRWTQTLKELQVFVPVRAGLRSKHLRVEYTRSKLVVGIRGEDMIVDGDLFALILG